VTTTAFIGDELTAAGFRLAGARVHSPPAAEIPELFRRLVRECELLLLSAEAAAAVPQALMQRVTAAGRPLLLVVSDARQRRQPEDLTAMLRGKLGMSE
jgi:vacuolar-type H+-ATPase subunit F/Vma7